MAPGLFGPDLPLTRAQFAALIVRAEGWAGAPGPAFADVPASAWYGDAVRAAAGQDVLGGTSPLTFSPDLALTRAMLAALVPRVAGLRHVADDEASAPLPHPLRDAGSIEGSRVAASVHVLADADSLAPGAATRVHAYAHDAAGYIIPALFAWSASGGDVRHRGPTRPTSRL
jgi:hypothetical protein